MFSIFSVMEQYLQTPVPAVTKIQKHGPTLTLWFHSDRKEIQKISQEFPFNFTNRTSLPRFTVPERRTLHLK